MAKINNKIASVSLNAVENLGRKMSARTKQYENVMERRMVQATAMVWRIAHQRRPYISKQVQKRGFRTLSGNVHHNRVSDPNAALGVPVAAKNGGLLQSAIRQEVKRVGYGKYQGTVFVDASVAPYGKYMEFGTATVHARPFMRPAADLTREAIKKLFHAKVEMQ